MKGRKPAPTQLKIVKGNPGKRPLSKEEPKLEAVKLKPPRDLSDVAKKHWRLIAKHLHAAKITTQLDQVALHLYCDAYAKWVEANDQITKYGMVVKAPSGFPIQSPYLAISNKAFEQMKALLVEFGMTPSSRSRVKSVSDGKKNDGWDGF